ncbi:MAG: GNAT family N-acetyltransferase [Alkalibacterium gilvum]|uniref:Predicted N-acyltransferase, GNAT family n=1 Tax=Alkalibacterium gilvum TaxID=1130080 RepID=A0A1H6TCA2_9LACT|nr:MULTISPECIES: GNAT family N-acetyltransferase [Alkalibacterium]MDN6194660.1 GNAT family N-acetyltransferase [Alkalibacterium sp.]MDN6293148.1 GNAT family N-acetyltransferase [Alkalibacterium sp.]MDN6294948.1 GNAT family N-acetyltransferase [Alkalibacterium sp.]MDN6398311.1 GNAT family N-acetyltransferase [Alkalibacterium sp.]MDN6729589.1 GNAT family N-acetyltransferase [Alkalibacterium sp.]
MDFKITTDISSNIYQHSIAIREEVFIKEQAVDPALEIDELEAEALHIVGYIDTIPVCTARLLKKQPDSIKIQRVAVLSSYRKMGIGKKLLNYINDTAMNQFDASFLVLDSQDHAIPFYEKEGYSVYGDGFLDAGIPHHSMKKGI